MKKGFLFLSIVSISTFVLSFNIASAQNAAPNSVPPLENPATQVQDSTMQKPVEANGKRSVRGVAFIEGTSDESLLSGVVNFSETSEGLLVEADIFDVPNPGEHGFHIHEVGSCEDGGKAAGGHFNPASAKHGMLMKDGPQAAHAGDMGNITIDENGEGTLSVVLPDVGLVNGKYNVSGLSVILHEKADDFSQPTGNAGGRIGCGVIEIDDEELIFDAPIDEETIPAEDSVTMKEDAQPDAKAMTK